MTAAPNLFDRVSEWRAGQDIAIQSAQASSETLYGFFNTPRILPAYVGSLSDEVAFATDGIDGTTAPTLGTLVLIPVTVTQDRPIDALKAGFAANTMTNLYIGLYDCNESTGNLTKVLDLGDRKSNLNTSFNQQTFPLIEAVSVQRGELYYIGLLQVGGTAAAMHRKSLATNFTTGLFPKYLGSTYATTGISVLPSTITDANVVSGTRFWGALGTAAAPVTSGGVFLSDSFNRADNASSLGPNWTIRDGAGGIAGNKPQASIFSTMYATHTTRLSSVAQRVGFTRTTSGVSDHSISLRGNGLGPYVELYIQAEPAAGSTPAIYRAYIQTWTSYSRFSSPTSRASVNMGSAAALSGNWTFDAVGNVYTGYLNGGAVIVWTDSGGAFTVASNNTEVGFYTSDNFSPTFDDFLAQDL